MRALVAIPVAAAAAVGVLSMTAGAGAARPAQQDDSLAAVGAELYATQCVSCHAPDGSGVEGRGPSLAGEGEASADFVLRTGRMPIAQPGIQAKRGPVRYTETEIRALVAHVGGLGDGPGIPDVDPAAGDLARGAELYRVNCAACHVATGAGAAIGGDRIAPSLMPSTPTQIGEAILIGPGAMPVFGTFSEDDINSVARYIGQLQDEDAAGVQDFGGAGPVAEGLAAWLLALLPLIALTRWIGSSHEGRDEPVAPSEPAEGIVT